MTLLEVYTNILSTDKDRIIDEVFSSLSKEIIELNQNQLSYGLNAEGKKFRRYKNAAYSNKKARMNSRPGIGIPDLKVKGNFWEDFKTDIRSGVIDIYSTNFVAEFLEDGTSKMQAFDNIYGLTPESMEVLRDDFLTLFNDKLKAEIGL